MKCKWYRQMRNRKSSVCDDSNIRAGFSLPLQSSASKAARRHGKGYSMGSHAQGNLNLQEFLSQRASLDCSVKRRIYGCPHTHARILSSTGCTLYCSPFNFKLRNWGGGKTGGGPREVCPALHPAQMHTSGSPPAG